MVDAILCDPVAIRGKGFVGQAIWANKHFGPILGTDRVHGRKVSGSRVLFTPSGTAATLHYPTDHPLAGHERYTWTDRGDGVMLGTLKMEAVSHAS